MDVGQAGLAANLQQKQEPETDSLNSSVSLSAHSETGAQD
jgi:hypothetical protein